MDEKVLECMQYLIQRGNDVILYTDQDRKELTEGTDKYGKELVYLPDAVSAALNCNIGHGKPFSAVAGGMLGDKFGRKYVIWFCHP